MSFETRLLEASVTMTGESFPMLEAPCSIQASVSGVGAVSATVALEVNNDGVWLPFDTLSMSGTTVATAASACGVRYNHMRARVTALSGAGALVRVTAVG